MTHITQRGDFQADVMGTTTAHSLHFMHLPASIKFYLYAFCCAVLLVACGGSDTSETNPATELTLTPSGWHLRGSVIKGPVAHAKVTLHLLDTNQQDFYDPQTPLASGFTDAFASLNAVFVSDTYAAPFILVADAREGIDVHTGQQPVLKTLVNVVTQTILNTGQAVYATPLTTLAFHMARRDAGTGASSEAFLAAMNTAANRIKSVIGIELPAEVNILTSPPVLTGATLTTEAQHAVAQHRAALEALAALIHQMAQNSGIDPDMVLKTLAQDLQSDGIVDGAENGQSLAGLDVAILGTNPTSLLVPNTDVPVIQIGTVLQRDQNYLPANIVIDEAALAVTTSNRTLAVTPTENIPTDRDPPLTPRALTLAWNPSAGFVSGYLIYRGATTDNASQLIRTLVIADGAFDPLSPATSFDPVVDLSLSIGDSVCFRVKAYNEAGESDFSEPVCTNI